MRLVGRTWEERRVGVAAANNYLVNRDAAGAEAWLPQTVRDRQAAFAAIAPNVWPTVP